VDNSGQLEAAAGAADDELELESLDELDDEELDSEEDDDDPFDDFLPDSRLSVR